jgi:hypothetical protein
MLIMKMAWFAARILECRERDEMVALSRASELISLDASTSAQLIPTRDVVLLPCQGAFLDSCDRKVSGGDGLCIWWLARAAGLTG